MVTNLLTTAERKAIIERLLKEDKEMYKDTKKELKKLRNIYSQWDDAKLLSIKLKGSN